MNVNTFLWLFSSGAGQAGGDECSETDLELILLNNYLT